MEKLTKSKTMLFMDIAGGEAPDWARIGKSTIFDLALNPETETADYIDNDYPEDILKSYKPTLPEELALLKGDKAFDAMYEKFLTLPTGEKAKIPTLIVFPVNKGTEDAPKFDAWKCNALVTFSNYNSVEAKLSFDISFGGTIEMGVATVEDGQPSFTEGTEAAGE